MSLRSTDVARALVSDGFRMSNLNAWVPDCPFFGVTGTRSPFPFEVGYNLSCLVVFCPTHHPCCATSVERARSPPRKGPLLVRGHTVGF